MRKSVTMPNLFRRLNYLYQQAKQPTDFWYRITFVFILAVFYIEFNYYAQKWTFVDNGLSPVIPKTPYWDFNNLWLGGKLYWQDQLHLIFEPENYRRAMDAAFGMDVPDQEWSYPPSMLLIGAPLALLPIGAAYHLYTAAGLIVWHFALRLYRLPLLFHLAALLCPAFFFNAYLGQNSTLVMACLIAALHYLPKRPVLAGLLIGLMTVKPHLGVLLPVILLASRKYSAFSAAALTALALALVSAAIFGASTWLDFIYITRPLMNDIMNAPPLQTYQNNAVTPFIFARNMGLSLSASYLAQAVFLLAALWLCWKIWRPSSKLAHLDRIILTLPLVLLASPYGYSYDMQGFCFAIGLLLLRYPVYLGRIALATLWTFPLYNIYLAGRYQIVIGALISFSALALFYLVIRQNNGSDQIA